MFVHVTDPIPPQVTVVMSEREAQLLRTVAGNFTTDQLMDHVAFGVGHDEAAKWLGDLYQTLTSKLFPNAEVNSKLRKAWKMVVSSSTVRRRSRRSAPS